MIFHKFDFVLSVGLTRPGDLYSLTNIPQARAAAYTGYTYTYTILIIILIRKLLILCKIAGFLYVNREKLYFKHLCSNTNFHYRPSGYNTTEIRSVYAAVSHSPTQTKNYDFHWTSGEIWYICNKGIIGDIPLLCYLITSNMHVYFIFIIDVYCWLDIF